MSWKKAFKRGKELTVATCSSKGPHANIVLSLGFVDDKLLIANSQMENTFKNLGKNKKVCIVSEYYRIKGTVEIFSSRKYFAICNKVEKKYPVKSAILVKVEEVFDLDKVIPKTL